MNSGTGDDVRRLPPETLVRGLTNRVLQSLARSAPGQSSLRIWLHRWRGVRIGSQVRIGNDVIIDTAYPSWVSIGNGVQLGIGVLILAHLHGLPPRLSEWDGYVSVRIDDEANIGPRVVILPHVTIGRGAVVTAGSVVTRSVPPLTLVQGNPARPMARCDIPLNWDTSYKRYLSRLRPLDPTSEKPPR